MPDQTASPQLSRQGLLGASTAVAAAPLMAAVPVTAPARPPVDPHRPVDMAFTVNGQQRNAIKLFTTACAWTDGKLTVWEPSQNNYGF